MSRRRKDDKAARRAAPRDASSGEQGTSTEPARVRTPASAVVVNGWSLLFWTEFRDRWAAMSDAAREARNADPDGYLHAPEGKFFRTVRELVFRETPTNPDHPQFRQGKTLGPAHSHWRRAKFHRRFRLFFRFHSASRTIIYAWLNDENTLRKAGSQTDVYAVFRGMLERGAPPTDWDALAAAAKAPASDANHR